MLGAIFWFAFGPMLMWIGYLLGKRTPTEKLVKPGNDLPVIGSKYLLKSMYTNPFDRDKYAITVVDVREGWIQYRIIDSLYAISLSDFRLIYRLASLPPGEGEK